MDLPKRKSPRIPNYDYSTANFYFVTICTFEKKCIFGNPGKLNWMGKAAEENLLMISQSYPNIRLDKYVVMPNHNKMSVTKRIRKDRPDFQVWQRSYHDHVIRNQARYERIWMYIENNPQKWEEDCFYISAEQNER